MIVQCPTKLKVQRKFTVVAVGSFILFIFLGFCSCHTIDQTSIDVVIPETNTSLTTDAKRKQSPNIIIVYADDLGYGDLGSFGNPVIRTPELDRMAVEGQKWTQFYSADPVCTPSRAGLLTGRYPIRNGMTSAKRAVFFPDSPGGLPQEEITIAEMLKQKNYATAIIGKWHLGHLSEHLPNTQGFDYYWGIPYSNDMDLVPESENYFNESADPMFVAKTEAYNVPIIENFEVVERPANQHTISRRYTQKAVDYINQNKDKPFFLYVPHSMPHIPLFTHPERLGKSKRGLYGDVIEEIDWSVGQILNAVKENNLEKHTLVIFSSDNGPWLLFKTHGGSSGPLRAGKGTAFEGGQRVPTIFWGPGIVNPGIVDELGSTLDIMKTISVLANVAMPSDRKMDSYDLSPLLNDPKTTGPRDHFYYWAFGRLHGVRHNHYKLHIHSMEEVLYWNPVELERPLLFDIEHDIAEKYDLYDAMPDMVGHLQEMIAAHVNDTQDAAPDNLAAKMPK